jgi:hypothetical protein
MSYFKAQSPRHTKIFDRHTLFSGFSISLLKPSPTNCTPCQRVKSDFELYAEIAK